MNLKEIMYARRSIRKFKDTKVKDEDIKYLLEVAMLDLQLLLLQTYLLVTTKKTKC